ncbi:hypothetical protein BHE74_00036172 [Ensete ventricosum]|nr:hypothetical protein BHE74_00036172 [Ensete ventricosum]
MDHREGGEDIESRVDGVEAPREMKRNGSNFFDDKKAGMREPLLRRRTMNTTSQLAVVGANVCPIESLDYE